MLIGVASEHLPIGAIGPRKKGSRRLLIVEDICSRLAVKISAAQTDPLVPHGLPDSVMLTSSLDFIDIPYAALPRVPEGADS